MQGKKIKCPTCGKATSWQNNKFKPFCSEFCLNRDLAAWADEKYRIPAREETPDNEQNSDKEDEIIN